jgi:hypothetical protein
MSLHTLRSLLADRDPRERSELARAWGQDGTDPETGLAAALGDEERVESRLIGLPRKLRDLFESFLGEPGRCRSARSLQSSLNGAFHSRYEIEAALAALHREGFLLPTHKRNWDEFGEPAYAVPGELAQCIDSLRRRQRHEPLDVITLRGHLEARLGRTRGNGSAPSADHARKIYKLYLMESSIRARADALAPDVRRVFDLALTSFGGFLPHQELARSTGGDGADLDLMRKCLEESMLGTVAPLRLARFGIQPAPPTVIVFHEVALLELRRHSELHPVDVEQTLAAGVDFVTNVGRFLREVAGSKVQFTVDGNLYRASGKRIERGLMPVPGEVLDGDGMLQWIWRFCLARRFVSRSGERGLRVTDQGREFDERSARDKTLALLSYAVEERELPGEPFHHTRLRRILLRLMKRIEPERWYEAPFLPFLARNSYLTLLGEHGVEDAFAARFQEGGYLPTESIQQLVWNLLQFVRRRLYPLGIVDLGIRGGRTVALRLTRFGAELLGAGPAGEIGGERSTLLVNPDFEVVLFPGDDEHEVVHLFDRFATRSKSDHVHHFKLSRESLFAGLRDGLSLAQILQELTDRARAPLPQNVRYSLEDWADAAAVVVLDADLLLTARKPEQIDRIAAVPALQELLAGRMSPTSLRFDAAAPVDRIVGVLSDLGFAVGRG